LPNTPHAHPRRSGFCAGDGQQGIRRPPHLVSAGEPFSNESRLAVGGALNAELAHPVAKAVERYLLEAGVEVYAVDILNDFPQPTWTADGPLLLGGICWAGSGESVQIEQYTKLADVIEQVAREMRSQYILSYQPSTLAKPGKYHRVNLKVSPPPGRGRVFVSWRHGYYEPRD
jgi:hypothetical protein